MSFVSSVLISMIEKELSSQAPEIEAYVLDLIGTFGKDLVQYVEKKIGSSTQAPPTSDVSNPSQ